MIPNGAGLRGYLSVVSPAQQEGSKAKGSRGQWGLEQRKQRTVQPQMLRQETSQTASSILQSGLLSVQGAVTFTGLTGAGDPEIANGAFGG